MRLASFELFGLLTIGNKICVAAYVCNDTINQPYHTQSRFHARDQTMSGNERKREEKESESDE